MTGRDLPLGCLAVIFTSERSAVDDGYDETASTMIELARLQPGFLGVDSVRDAAAPGRPGITVSYWSDADAIAAWRAQLDHVLARAAGRERWYERYVLVVARVERVADWER